jgi:ACS family hexuronate transporter-like MFS transporter
VLTEDSSTPLRKRFGYRWTILALLFFATTINYVDRQVIGILAPTLTREFHWSESDYGAIVSWFSIAYGVGLLVIGRLIDRIGVRLGYAFALSAWSVAAVLHAFVRTVPGFSAVRAFLGAGESANFPAAVKSVAEWFPKKERALATGIFNAGTNVGVVAAALMVPWITLTLGWRWAFITTGLMGLVWIPLWLGTYRDPSLHPKVSPAELTHIRSDPDDPPVKIPWRRLLKHRPTWAFVVGKAMTDPVWLFYLFWLPKFLDENWGVELAGLALPLIVIYAAADLGSVAGGWLSGALIKRGWSINAGRKTTLLMLALMIVPTMLAPTVRSMWAAVAIVAVAASAHQGWSANLFTTVSDMFPRRAVASVIGIGGFAGMFTAFMFQRFTGDLLDATGGNYGPIFVVLALAYVTALFIMHLLVPRMEPVRLDRQASA